MLTLSIKSKQQFKMANNTRKITQALAYLGYHMPDKSLSAMKAFKLLWLADRCHLRQNGRTISGDRYFALPKGMVPTDAKHLLDGELTALENPSGYFDQWIEKAGEPSYHVLREPDLKEFSKSDIDVLERVLSLYGSKSGKELSELSHKYPEWKYYRDMLGNKREKNSFPINIDLMFENSDEDNSPLFDQSSEVLEETREIYHEFNS